MGGGPLAESGLNRGRNILLRDSRPGLQRLVNFICNIGARDTGLLFHTRESGGEILGLYCR